MLRVGLCSLAVVMVRAGLYFPEPSEAEYWGNGTMTEAPYAVPRFSIADMNRTKFDELVIAGRAFVVSGVGDASPMHGWNCDTFREDPSFSGAEMQMMYAKGGGAPFVGFKTDWMKQANPSGAADEEAPQKAPFYWGIKDVQYNDGGTSPTWRKAMLQKVRAHTAVPPFMDAANKGQLYTTPEFWFAVHGAGAKAHIDTHVQTTMSLQLASRKRWRIGFMPERMLQHLSMLYKDGSVYTHGTPWVPTHDLVLEEGEALFIPPGFIHETHNLGEECAASVTYQFSVPMATGLYSTFMGRVRRTPDIWESWPLLREWATMGMHQHEASPAKMFAKVDRDSDGIVTMQELSMLRDLERSRPSDILTFLDMDRDGAISIEEFKAQHRRWASLEEDAMSDESNPDLGIGVGVDQMHYEVLEDVDNHPRFASTLERFQRSRMAEEHKLAEERKLAALRQPRDEV